MARRPQCDDGLICPLHKVATAKVCHKCPLWTQVRGSHPQTGQDIDQWACSLAWLPVLLIENSQMQRQTGAAVESFRNEAVRSSERALTMRDGSINLGRIEQ